MKIYKQKGYVGREIGPIMSSRSTCFEVSTAEGSDVVGLRNRNSLIRDVEIEIIDCVSQIKEDPLFILGSVEFIEMYIGDIKPDYYPDWLSGFMRREILAWVGGETRYFAKPSKYKRFKAGIFKGKYIQRLDYLNNSIITEVVNFVDEWRYYVADGKVLTSWWYQGNEETCENNPNGPSINHLPIPEDFCGTIDMGLLDTGELALVECHHPYAIGWYGDQNDIENYINFLIKGFKYLKTQ